MIFIKRFSSFLLESERLNNSSYIEHLNGIINITSGKQKEWYEWQRDNAELVNMEIPDDVFPEITKEWSIKNLKLKDCYKNASLITNLDPEIKYVEGVMIFMGIPIEHAWNSYKGRHFDATAHLWNPREENNLHYKLLELEGDALWKILGEAGVYGGIPSYLFRKGRL